MAGVTAFVAGAVLMALELLGSRILAPHLGNSIFVWGSLIGVVLAALSLGYALGGVAADRLPDRGVLAAVLVAAGAWVWWLSAKAGPWTAAIAARDLGPRLGPLAAAGALFFPPGVLLGAVSPWLVRLEAPAPGRVGRVAGRLYALSTAGSIAGTLATAFWLIPLWPVESVLRALAAALGLVAAPLAGRRRLPVAAVAAGLAVLAALAPGGTRPAVTADGARILYERDTLYHHLRVEDRGDSRFLRFDDSWQSGMYLHDPVAARFEYTDVMHAGWALNPGARRVLLVGLGGGSIPKRVLASYPDVRVDVVELDPEVVEVARRFFALPSDPRLRIFIDDGRRFLRRASGPYDLVLLDAYFADSIPFHLTTVEFLEELRSRLAPDGVAVANLIGAAEGPRSKLLRAMYRTYRQVFPQVYLLQVLPEDPREVQNVILLATARRPVLSPEELRARIAAWARQHPELEALAQAADLVYDRPIDVADVPVLRDAHAPVDALLHLYRDEVPGAGGPDAGGTGVGAPDGGSD